MYTLHVKWYQTIFYEDQEFGLFILPKLSYEHIKVTPYSIKFAASILTFTVS